MIRKIYIRHADKGYKNGKSDFFKHDPAITEIGIKRSRVIAQILIQHYGIPTRIICSPYRRARETAIIMNMMLDNPLDLEVDADLSEYLGNHPKVELDVVMATKIHQPPHPETFDQMKLRVKKHYDRLKKQEYYKEVSNKEGGKNEVIWIITHGIIMKQICNFLDIKPNKYFSCLSCVNIFENIIMKKAEIITWRGELTAEKEEEDELANSRYA